MNPLYNSTPKMPVDINARIYSKITGQQPIIDGLVLPVKDSLSSSEVAPKFKFSKTPTGDIWYEDDAHVYFHQDELGDVRTPYISATTLLGAFETPFDEDAQAGRCASKPDYDAKFLDKRGWPVISKKERKSRILNAWETNRNDASFYGTATHAALEYLVKNRSFNADEAYNFMVGKYNYQNEIVREFAKDFATRFYPNIVTASHQVIAEPILYDMDLKVAGQSDLVVVDWENRLIHIADYKTNVKKPGSKQDAAYNNFQGVLNHLPQTKMVHYGLQIALYQTMLIKMYASFGQIFAPGLNYILWANRENGMIETVPVKYSDYANDVQRIYDYLLK